MIIEEVRPPLPLLLPLYEHFHFHLRPCATSDQVCRSEMWIANPPAQAGTRFDENELHDILDMCKKVFEEEEVEIPDGIEDKDMEKIPNKLLGARKGKRRGGKKRVWSER